MQEQNSIADKPSDDSFARRDALADVVGEPDVDAQEDLVGRRQEQGSLVPGVALFVCISDAEPGITVPRQGANINAGRCQLAHFERVGLLIAKTQEW